MDLIQCNRKKGSCRELSCFGWLVGFMRTMKFSSVFLSVMAMSPRTVCMWSCYTWPFYCLASWHTGHCLQMCLSPLLSEIPSIHAQQGANYSRQNEDHIGTLYPGFIKRHSERQIGLMPRSQYPCCHGQGDVPDGLSTAPFYTNTGQNHFQWPIIQRLLKKQSSIDNCRDTLAPSTFLTAGMYALFRFSPRNANCVGGKYTQGFTGPHKTPPYFKDLLQTLILKVMMLTRRP